jgi:hypothetical protein
MAEVVVVGSFVARESAHITVYDALPGGEERKGSLAAPAGA